MTLMQRRMVLMAVGKKARLPAEYQEVEWIEPNGEASIRTNISPNGQIFDVNIRYYKQTQATKSECIIATNRGSEPGDQYFSCSLRTGINKFGVYTGSWAEVTNSKLYGNIVEVQVAFDTTSPYVNGYVLADGESTTISKTTQNASNIGDGVIFFFNVGAAGRSWGSMRLHYCTIQVSGTMIGEFIPCYRKADDVIGLYETTTKTFFSKTFGTGTLTKGADV